jgi:hypothetical protein
MSEAAKMPEDVQRALSVTRSTFVQSSTECPAHWWSPDWGANVCLRRTCMCPISIPLCLRLHGTGLSRYALAGASSVLWCCGQEWVASRRRIRVGRERNVQRSLLLRSSGRVAGVGLWLRRVVWVMYHRTVWGSLERRWSRLMGVHSGSGRSASI